VLVTPEGLVTVGAKAWPPAELVVVGLAVDQPSSSLLPMPPTMLVRLVNLICSVAEAKATTTDRAPEISKATGVSKITNHRLINHNNRWVNLANLQASVLVASNQDIELGGAQLTSRLAP